MGVLDRTWWFARGEDTESYPYLCMSCQAELPVQYHSCPECGSYDIRAEKWIEQ